MPEAANFALQGSPTDIIWEKLVRAFALNPELPSNSKTCLHRQTRQSFEIQKLGLTFGFMSTNEGHPQQNEPSETALTSQAERLAEVVPLIIRKVIERKISSGMISERDSDDIHRGAIPKSDDLGKMKKG